MEKVDFSLYEYDFSPVFVLNEDLSVFYFNHSAANFLKLLPQDINHQKIKNLFSLSDEFWNDLKITCAVESFSESSEVEFLKNDESYTFIFRMIKKENYFILFCHNLSIEKGLHKKYREQVAELNMGHQELLKIDKVRALGELTSGISHEINNPLTVASGYTEILGFTLEKEDLNKERESIKGSIKNISESLFRIQDIIQGMKNFLHESVDDKKEYLIVNDIIETSIKLVESTFKKNNILLEVDNQAMGIQLLGNSTRLEQILINLMKNALDSLSSAKTQNPKVVLRALKNPDESILKIEVTDNGPGVPKEYQTKIFDNFFTTKEIGKGTGLGLSLCKKMAHDHNGDLEYVPNNNGATFLLTIPLRVDASHFTSSRSFRNSKKQLEKKVLIVDNDPAILDLCEKFLENTSYTFIGAKDGEEALRILEESSIDLVITDVFMPNLDGHDFVNKLREENNNVPTFYLSSGLGLETYQADKNTLELSGILMKPFNSFELIGLLDSVALQRDK